MKNENEARKTRQNKPRRTYEKPRIVSREKIEGRANVCDPLAGGKASPMSCAVAKS